MVQARGGVPGELIHAQRRRLAAQGKPASLAVLRPQVRRHLSKPGLAELVPGFLIAPQLSQHRDLASGRHTDTRSVTADEAKVWFRTRAAPRMAMTANRGAPPAQSANPSVDVHAERVLSRS